MSDLKIIQEKEKQETIEINRENYDHYNPENLVYKAEQGVTEE